MSGVGSEKKGLVPGVGMGDAGEQSIALSRYQWFHFPDDAAAGALRLGRECSEGSFAF